MAWETRKNRQYFYTELRVGRRVVSQYVGTGLTAELAAKLQTVANDEREMKSQLEAMEIAALATEDAEAEKFDEEVRLLVKSTLIAEGFHQHKGTWRRKRNGQTKTDQA